MARLYKNMEIQMRRASASIPLNIAEGSVKKSYREFLNFLSYAYGSSKELLLMISRDLGYISSKKHDNTHSKLDKLMAELFGFIENIEARFEKKKKFFTKYEK